MTLSCTTTDTIYLSPRCWIVEVEGDCVHVGMPSYWDGYSVVHTPMWIDLNEFRRHGVEPKAGEKYDMRIRSIVRGKSVIEAVELSA